MGGESTEKNTNKADRISDHRSKRHDVEGGRVSIVIPSSRRKVTNPSKRHDVEGGKVSIAILVH